MLKRIGIAGVTGLVGTTLLRILESGPQEITDLRLFASSRSTGAKVRFRDRDYEVKEVEPEGFKDLDVAFFCLEAGLAKKLAPKVAKHCPVIDKSSEFRLRDDVPLVVPEVNPDALKGHKNIIANPNCTTIPLVVALNPLHRRFGLERVWLASYQSASGAGRELLDQLHYETEFIALRRPPDTTGSPLPAQLADNVIPQIDALDAHGHSGEELKTIRETARILGLPGLKVTSTCVRVPVTIGHSLAVTGRFSRAVKVGDALRVLKDAPGIVLSPGNELATPADCRDKDAVFVCRVRPGAEPEELSFWVTTDNLRKGAALNAVQIAGLLLPA
uniref:Aspartate-semialdehyde dehydrogenase n=1 Tax=candidate division WOR-3 bacterium TaxID=2052148 RepID=A0A7C4CBK3_UNCW3